MAGETSNPPLRLPPPPSSLPGLLVLPSSTSVLDSAMSGCSLLPPSHVLSPSLPPPPVDIPTSTGSHVLVMPATEEDTTPPGNSDPVPEPVGSPLTIVNGDNSDPVPDSVNLPVKASAAVVTIPAATKSGINPINLPVESSPAVANIPTAMNSGTNSTLPWAARLKSSLRNLKKSASPTYLPDGTPVVQAPPSVILKDPEQWGDFLVAQFLGTPPPPSKIFSDLNPIWGKFGDISIKRKSHTSFYIFIPNRSTRDWVLQIRYWQSDNVGIIVSQWSTSDSLEEQPMISVPIWVKFSDIPLRLYTLEGISNIASAVGEPLHTENSRLNAATLGEAKVKVEIQVDSIVPKTIEVHDQFGNSVTINATYPRLPPKCEHCKEFGHIIPRCLKLKQDRRTRSRNLVNMANEATLIIAEGNQEVGANKEAATAPVIAASPVKVPELPLTKAPLLEIVIPPIAIPAVAAALPPLISGGDMELVVETTPQGQIIVNNQQNEKEKENNVMSVGQMDSTNHPIEHFEHLAPAHSSPISVTSATNTISDSATTEDGEIIASAQKNLRAISKSPAIPKSQLPSSKKKTKMKKLSDIYSSPLSSIKLH